MSIFISRVLHIFPSVRNALFIAPHTNLIPFSYIARANRLCKNINLLALPRLAHRKSNEHNNWFNCRRRCSTEIDRSSPDSSSCNGSIARSSTRRLPLLPFYCRVPFNRPACECEVRSSLPKHHHSEFNSRAPNIWTENRPASTPNEEKKTYNFRNHRGQQVHDFCFAPTASVSCAISSGAPLKVSKK